MLEFTHKKLACTVLTVHTHPTLLRFLVQGAVEPRDAVAQGILAPADAQMAVAAGVDGIMLSNHGGRQLDYAPSPVEMLPHGETSLAIFCTVSLSVNYSEKVLRRQGAQEVPYSVPYRYKV